MQKTKRIVNKELLEYIRKELFCIVCGAPNPQPHHVSTKGSGGQDTADNLMPLCFREHRLWHDKGAKYMTENYPSVLRWLENAGRQDVLDKIKRSK